MALELKDIGFLNPVTAGVILATEDQSKDMEAMNKYMVHTSPVNSKASALKTEWNAWFNDLGWYNTNLDKASWMVARNKIGEFNLANTNSSAERDMIAKIQQQGAQLELERLAETGKKAPIDVSSGKFILPKNVESPSKLKFRWVLLGATASVASGLAAYVSPIGKIPLGMTSLLAFLGTGTYTAFKIED